jgi:hypothetical protein
MARKEAPGLSAKHPRKTRIRAILDGGTPSRPTNEETTSPSASASGALLPLFWRAASVPGWLLRPCEQGSQVASLALCSDRLDVANSRICFEKAHLAVQISDMAGEGPVGPVF